MCRWTIAPAPRSRRLSMSQYQTPPPPSVPNGSNPTSSSLSSSASSSSIRLLGPERVHSLVSRARVMSARSLAGKRRESTLASLPRSEEFAIRRARPGCGCTKARGPASAARPGGHDLACGRHGRRASWYANGKTANTPRGSAGRRSDSAGLSSSDMGHRSAARSFVGQPGCLVGERRSFVGERRSLVRESRSFVGERRSLVRESRSPVRESRSLVGRAEGLVGAA